MSPLPFSFALGLVLYGGVARWCHAQSTFPENVRKNEMWRRESCRANQFLCLSGECIARFFMCDGVLHCRDHSDEKPETCSHQQCSPHSFRCDYGACVDEDVECDGIKDCVDGSDEVGCFGVMEIDPSACRARQFLCMSGMCIDPYRLCDGKKDCDDGTDETEKVCRNFNCPSFFFRCSYGGCIHRNYHCDGKPQCADGSDEVPSDCEVYKRPIPLPIPTPVEEMCALPDQPRNGWYELARCNPPSCVLPPPGTMIKNGVLVYTCPAEYILRGRNDVVCNGKWQGDFPECVKAFCKPLTDQSREFQCTLGEKILDCKEPVAPGTHVIARCSTFFNSTTEHLISHTTCLENGTWSSPIPSCAPVCGLPRSRPEGTETELVEYPWHAGIFRFYASGKNAEQWCGGTIVSLRAVVTAAHCFSELASNNFSTTSLFRIVLGKYYREWQRTTGYEQVLEVDKVIVHEQFHNNLAYINHDIAVVIVKTEVNISPGIQPICIDYSKQVLDFFGPGKTGIVMGWGLTENNVQTDILKAVTFPYVESAVCETRVPETMRAYLTPEKFCAGYHNGTSVCRGDCGGGFATQFRDGKYYLLGVVSMILQQGCYDFHYATLTKLFENYDVLEKALLLENSEK